jgi:hypothetical protein
MSDVLDNVETFQKVDEFMRVFRSAVRKAQAESRRLGVPNVYFIDGQVLYELPNGEYTRNRPSATKSTVPAPPSDRDGQSGESQRES